MPFLTLFYLYAFLLKEGESLSINDLRAAYLYVGLRALYPLLAIGGNGIALGSPLVGPIMALSTFPGYAILGYFGYGAFNAVGGIASFVQTIKSLF